MKRWAALAWLTVTLTARAAGALPEDGGGLIGLSGFGWVDDTVRLDRRLQFAASWGYRDFVYAFNAPFLEGPAGSVNWRRDSATGWRWELADGSRPGLADARAAVVAGIRARAALSEKHGLRFVPAFGPWGWGNVLTYIDPATGAGAWYDIRLPAFPLDAFIMRSRDSLGAVASTSQWGDPGGGASMPFGKDGKPAEMTVTRKSPGLYAATFSLVPGRDAWWTLSFEAVPAGPASPGDSVFLKAYLFQGAETHPFSTKAVAIGARALSAGPGLLSAGFFSKAGETYSVDLEVRTAAARGASVRFRKARMVQGMPPRARLIDASAYEAAGPGGTSLLDRQAAAGHPGEKELYTRVTSRKRRWEDVRFFQLDPALRDSAWAALDGVRGHFADQAADPVRRTVDPLAPATRQMFHAMVDAAAEAMGKKPERYLLGGDEVFTWSSARYSRPPWAGLDRGSLMAKVLLGRMREIDSIFSARYPSDTTDISYILYGDLLGAMHGIGERTLGAVAALGAAELRPGKILVAPWYYDTHVKESQTLYRRYGFPDSLKPPEKFEALIRKDVEAYRAAGLDFLGLYSTDGPGVSREDELAGAAAWASVCRDYRDGARGRCRGLYYAGWDPDLKAEWGNPYNGLVSIAWYGWLGGAAGSPPSAATSASVKPAAASQPAAAGNAAAAPRPTASGTVTGTPVGSAPEDPLLDADGDGVLDVLKAWRHGPVPPRPPAAAVNPAAVPPKKVSAPPKPAVKPAAKPKPAQTPKP